MFQICYWSFHRREPADLSISSEKTVTEDVPISFAESDFYFQFSWHLRLFLAVLITLNPFLRSEFLLLPNPVKLNGCL
jgi:hypothetical protein